MTHLELRLQSDYATLQGKQKSAATREASIGRLQLLLAPHLPAPCSRAIDLGAGQGELLVALQRLGCGAVSGVELSPSQVQQAQLHGCTALVLGDALATLEGLQDSSLDLVTCFDVFEHLTHDTCAQWFAQIQRVLRPGGRLIGHVPNGLSPLVGSVYWGDITHLWCPVPESIQVFCRSSSLQWLGAYENIGSSLGLKGRLRTLAWRGVRTLLAIMTMVESGRNSFAWPWSRTFLFVAERPRL
jgi:SAM-dependent methyltransferase